MNLGAEDVGDQVVNADWRPPIRLKTTKIVESEPVSAWLRECEDKLWREGVRRRHQTAEFYGFYGPPEVRP